MLAIGVAKGVNVGVPRRRRSWRPRRWRVGAVEGSVEDDDVEIDTRWMGPDYGVPTAAGAEAARWAAVHGGWVLDDTYTAKGFAGLLGNAATGRWRPGTDVVFVHTGGLPAVFACGRRRRARRSGTSQTWRRKSAAAVRAAVPDRSAGRSAARSTAPNGAFQ